MIKKNPRTYAIDWANKHYKGAFDFLKGKPMTNEQVELDIEDLSSCFDIACGYMDVENYDAVDKMMLEAIQSDDVNFMKCLLVVTKGMKPKFKNRQSVVDKLTDMVGSH